MSDSRGGRGGRGGFRGGGGGRGGAAPVQVFRLVGSFPHLRV